MFAKLDGNSNEAITLEELSKLERRGSKDCIEPFLDRCDLNNDQKLSLDEWCDCFKWAGKGRAHSPLNLPVTRAALPLSQTTTRSSYFSTLTIVLVLGAFTPECDVDGFYKFKQCHEGFCWCVDKWGREFDQSRVRGQPDCGQYGKY
ncbi:unnamed protein product [Soboliphyme baturini]|uniref:Thyroglobulin type-1 domain-containing protein n=1 Tax=Soboliphyme baturini TaxID=241478 RepID=A0A183IR31_9BILA|nr:unnamed protein product [Soboliphyme baturini]